MRSSKARSQRKGSIGFGKEAVSTFRSYLKCCGIIRRAVDVGSEGKERFEVSKGVKVLSPDGEGMVWEQQ